MREEDAWFKDDYLQSGLQTATECDTPVKYLSFHYGIFIVSLGVIIGHKAFAVSENKF